MPKITIKAARVNAGLTQRQAAKKLGIAYQTLSNYESGASVPRVDMIEKMAKTYRIDKRYIFLGR
ncbi:helix-turn-helix domain-containing protein [Lactobacillus delbrueckii]|jgi:transcriptional regulator with XRE-family HTH domain|uniref:helix-turn-helix domain-containing protein n=1 Tax=Lactobacillus delbrueckii TaxID=1584 RepID=UPI001F332FAF|nr:helix-turn-helix transcriptional regulator [Lactobacillus delbrueckii]GHN43047.1 transcriptional regulator [Lactobacillus delbrueckii]